MSEYVRCTNCSFVYKDCESICPQCLVEKGIVESKDSSGGEPIFNICD